MIDDDVGICPAILLQCFDKDEINDDFLGSISINIDTIISKGCEEGIYKLKGVQQGELFLRFEWFSVCSDKKKLHKFKTTVLLNNNKPLLF